MRRNYDEVQLLKSMAGDDAQAATAAFRQLYDAHVGALYSTARQFLKTSEAAKDLVQEIFTAIWLKRKDFTEINHFRSYLYIMTRNAAVNHITRMAKNALAHKEFTERTDAHDSTTDERRHVLLQQVLEELPPKRRQVFRLAKEDGLSHEVIANRLNISTHTVSNHMKKALHFVRERLQDASAIIWVCVVLPF